MSIIELRIKDRYLIPATIAEIDLPGDIYSILTRTYQPEMVTASALARWQGFFGVTEFEQRLTILESAGDLEVKENKKRVTVELNWLSDLRKSGTRLVDVWKLLDEKHKAPKKLKKLVKSVGHFKDLVWFNGRFPFDKQELLKNARKIGSGLPEFRVASFDSFYGKYREYVEEIGLLLAKSQLTLEEHHILRRRVRTLRHYFMLAGSLTNDQSLDALAKFLEPVSTEMGKAQNIIVGLELAGDVNGTKDKTVLSLKHRQTIEAFLKLHQSV